MSAFTSVSIWLEVTDEDGDVLEKTQLAHSSGPSPFAIKLAALNTASSNIAIKLQETVPKVQMEHVQRLAQQSVSSKE